MRPDDFFEDDLDDFLGTPGRARRFRSDLVRDLRGGPLNDVTDLDAGLALARLLHDELEAFGTGGGEELRNEDMREALLALREVVERLGISGFDPEFRDFGTFKSYWLRNDGYGSWQARRDLLETVFEPLHDQLAVLESKSLTAILADPISPRGRTGWSAVDAEITELRRHFNAARSPQDYRNVGNDCVTVLEAISRAAFDPARHLEQGEEEPPVAKTKQRLDRVISMALPGAANSELRKLARAAIEMAQAVKHQTTPSRRDAGIAADSVILLANLIRRLDET